ncbi:flagellar assembly protein FliX [Polymorphum gilvum]|uniref:Flagellar assembly regulator FliX n=1 Tax=Polymorphum gilvum (strain LMG 25793 / CGMCC 1.9160 / SL003B-26A1) TaxID=991905 RepID=F2J435_POLGS|nr:flagellar assembly protein FliX [Polymorphum gilvum]ADZ69961.1 hypothetical protein SL003B_1533 [Polymorphum gilvum SL003B-26A1]
MRITGNKPISAVQSRSGKKRADGTTDGFVPDLDGDSHPAASLTSGGAIHGIDSLLALQEVSVEPDSRDLAGRRGHTMLDSLDAMKADLLAGVVSPGRLEDLARQLADRQMSDDAGMEAVIDEIELRVRVELAKHGKYPD